MRSTSATTVLLQSLSSFVAGVDRSAPWGIGYSGGRDSTVLLWALVQLVGPDRLHALHVDHGLRSPSERLDERRLVEAQCRGWNVTFHAFDPPSNPGRTEALARDHRYRCFQGFLDQYPGALVWLAHHADDQAETVLMRILKGHSWQGLGGMVPRRGPFVRPLLGLRGTLLAQVAAEQGLAFHQDSTNGAEAYTRNYLRNRVFPLILERFPGAVEALDDFAGVWRDLAPGVTPSPLWQVGGEGARLSADVWDSWSSLERQGQLLAVTQALGSSVSLSRRFLETVARAPTAAEGAGWSWARDGHHVVWQRVVHPSAMEYFIQVEWDRTYEGPDWSLRWSRNPSPGALTVEALDPEVPLVCCSPQPGARYASVEGEWDRAQRRHRFASGRGTMLCCQEGLVRLVLNTETQTVLWAEKGAGKLQKARIFVTLTKRSEYERR